MRLPSAAFRVLPLSERFVPSIISSITPAHTAPLPSSLAVFIESVFLASSAVCRSVWSDSVPVILPHVPPPPPTVYSRPVSAEFTASILPA